MPRPPRSPEWPWEGGRCPTCWPRADEQGRGVRPASGRRDPPPPGGPPTPLLVSAVGSPGSGPGGSSWHPPAWPPAALSQNRAPGEREGSGVRGGQRFGAQGPAGAGGETPGRGGSVFLPSCPSLCQHRGQRQRETEGRSLTRGGGPSPQCGQCGLNEWTVEAGASAGKAEGGREELGVRRGLTWHRASASL